MTLSARTIRYLRSVFTDAKAASEVQEALESSGGGGGADLEAVTTNIKPQNDDEVTLVDAEHRFSRLYCGLWEDEAGEPGIYLSQTSRTLLDFNSSESVDFGNRELRIGQNPAFTWGGSRIETYKSIRPTTDGVRTIGEAGRRFADVYAQRGHFNQMTEGLQYFNADGQMGVQLLDLGNGPEPVQVPCSIAICEPDAVDIQVVLPESPFHGQRATISNMLQGNQQVIVAPSSGDNIAFGYTNVPGGSAYTYVYVNDPANFAGIEKTWVIIAL